MKVPSGLKRPKNSHNTWLSFWGAGHHEVFTDFSTEQQQEIVRFKELIEKHPLVSGLVLED